MAAMRMSADRQISARFLLREWQTVTVAFAFRRFLREDQRDGPTDDAAATEHDDVRPFNLDATADEKLVHTCRRARHETGRITERQLADVQRMKPVHILGRIDRRENLFLRNLPRQRRLNEDAVNFASEIQVVDGRQQLAFTWWTRQD